VAKVAAELEEVKAEEKERVKAAEEARKTNSLP
jgi:hypothetical protein